MPPSRGVRSPLFCRYARPAHSHACMETIWRAKGQPSRRQRRRGAGGHCRRPRADATSVWRRTVHGGTCLLLIVASPCTGTDGEGEGVCGPDVPSFDR